MVFRLQVFTQIPSKHQHIVVCLDYIAYRIWHDFLPTSNKPDVGSENITQGVFPPKQKMMIMRTPLISTIMPMKRRIVSTIKSYNEMVHTKKMGDIIKSRVLNTEGLDQVMWAKFNVLDEYMRRSFLELLLLVVNAQHCYIFTYFVKGLMIKVKIPNFYSFPMTSCFTVNLFLTNEAKLESKLESGGWCFYRRKR